MLRRYTPTNVLRTVASMSLLLLGAAAFGQNLEEIGVDKGVKVNGSVNLNTILYQSYGIPQRRDPFNWFITGSLNVNVFGYNAPLSFSYSNANRSFSQPFNQFSFAPQYKWVKTYIGYSAMTFSPYTLAGHVFMGGGVELTPGKWRIAAMYGRLKKATPFDLSDSLQHSQAAFRRMGYGLKVGYEDNGNSVAISVFHARDELNSIPFVLPDAQLSPKQNIAVSIGGRKQFFQRFFIEGEYALSSLNNDLRVDGEQVSDSSIRSGSNLLKGVLPQNSTNRYFDAVNGSVGYQGDWYSIRLKYERVAPEYQTLGAYYFNNDLQNITIAPTLRLFKNKVNFGGNVGFQNNNLDNARESTTRRFVGAGNLAYIPNDKWNFNANYSNFNSFTNQRPLADPLFQNKLDTLNFYQVSETTTGTVVRMLGGTNNPQSIMLTGSYQQASDKASYMPGRQQSNFVSVNASYSYMITPSNLTLGVSGNYYANNAVGVETNFWGPALTVAKGFMEKTLRCTLTSAYNQTTSNALRAGPVLNNRLNVIFSPKSKGSSRNQLSLGLNALRRFEGENEQPAFTELTGTFNYSYSF